MAKVKMHEGFHVAERIINRLAMPIMVLLTLLIIADFTMDLAPYHTYVVIADWGILAFFIVDLTFKWYHTKGVLKFVRLYWLELVAVFPFYLVFRFFRELGLIGETIGSAQIFAHEAALARETELVSREAQVLREARLLREVQLAEEETRLFPRVIRFIQNSFRIVMARLGLAHESMVHHAETHKH